MLRPVTLQIKLDGEGLTRDTVGWPVFREFVDCVVSALSKMEDGPRADDLLPVTVKDGSLRTRIVGPDSLTRSAVRLRRGPTSGWSPSEVAGAEGLYKLLRSHGWSASMGRRDLRKVVVPEPVSPLAVLQRVTLRGEVVRVGGDDPKVAIRFDRFGHHLCATSREMAKRLSLHLYDRVEVSGVMRHDIRTDAMLDFDLREFRPVNDMDPRRVLQELWREMGDDAHVDVRARLKDLG